MYTFIQVVYNKIKQTNQIFRKAVQTLTIQNNDLFRSSCLLSNLRKSATPCIECVFYKRAACFHSTAVRFCCLCSYFSAMWFPFEKKKNCCFHQDKRRKNRLFKKCNFRRFWLNVSTNLVEHQLRFRPNGFIIVHWKLRSFSNRGNDTSIEFPFARAILPASNYISDPIHNWYHKRLLWCVRFLFARVRVMCQPFCITFGHHYAFNCLFSPRQMFCGDWKLFFVFRQMWKLWPKWAPHPDFSENMYLFETFSTLLPNKKLMFHVKIARPKCVEFCKICEIFVRINSSVTNESEA